MSIVVIDLEWNSGADRVRLDEILQIGAVKVERLDGPVVGVFSELVQPAVHNSFSPAMKHLALTPAELELGAPFPEAVSRFLDWCGPEAQIAAWGQADYRVLRENMQHWALEEPLPAFYCDLQGAFSQALGLTRSLALCAAVEYCAIPDALDFHDAVNDAFYSALVGGTMVKVGWQQALEQSPLLKTRREKYAEALPSQLAPCLVFSGRVVRGVESEGKLLSHGGIRRQKCPTCGGALSVSHWFPLEGGQIARTTCPEHGTYYFFCVPRKAAHGWEGWVFLLADGAPARLAYTQRDRQNAFSCRVGGKRRRRPKKAAKHGPEEA